MAELAPVLNQNLFGTVVHMSFFFLGKKKKPSLHIMPKKDTQVLTLCDNALPSFSVIIGCPSVNRRRHKNPLKSFHAISPRPCKQTVGAFRTGENSFKALICGPHAQQQQRTKHAQWWQDEQRTLTHRYACTQSDLPGQAKDGMCLAREERCSRWLHI